MIAQVTGCEVLNIRKIQDGDREISGVKQWIRSKERSEKNESNKYAKIRN